MAEEVAVSDVGEVGHRPGTEVAVGVEAHDVYRPVLGRQPPTDRGGEAVVAPDEQGDGLGLGEPLSEAGQRPVVAGPSDSRVDRYSSEVTEVEHPAAGEHRSPGQRVHEPAQSSA